MVRFKKSQIMDVEKNLSVESDLRVAFNLYYSLHDISEEITRRRGRGIWERETQRRLIGFHYAKLNYKRYNRRIYIDKVKGKILMTKILLLF